MNHQSIMLKIFVLLLLFSTGCTVTEVQPSSLGTALPTRVQPPSLGTALPTEVKPPSLSTALPTIVKRSPVEGWRIVPTNVRTQPLGGGWQILSVDLAIENGSDSWGRLYVDDNALKNIQVETAEGYKYSALPSSNMEATSQLQMKMPLPPRFRARGNSHIRVGVQFGRLFQLSFRVAENTSNFKITIPQYFVEVHSPRARASQRYTVTRPIILDLSHDVQAVEFPTDILSDTLQSISEPIEIKEKGTLVLNTVNYHEGKLVLDLTFKNSSGGYATDASADFYLLGTDGIMVENTVWAGTSFHAGPAQSVRGSAEFLIDPSVGDLKLIYLGEDGEKRVLQVGSTRPK